ncbi:RagB/SusD family nutrient uptake outer membrane protein [Siccationidurans ginsengisoli]|nr:MULTISPECIES: RagB/SusD family nutrient uptake outer membrane protein [unclassified Hymenobacter]MBO2030538.1 RagB/SusD family nutrient uptake outer membrane protein [Hymenobacter sp. BT559]
MQISFLRQLATRSALLLSLGLGLGACDKALNVEPQVNISSDKGYSTKEDAAAGLLGCYDGLQNTNYYGASFPSDVDMVSNNIIEVGTYNTTYGLIAQNQISADNVEIGTLWSSMYDTVNRCNYLLEETDKITDPAFSKLTTQGEARVIRAITYMNLLGLWGGTSQGYGYSGGLGVPLRLTPTTAIGAQTQPLARASEADVAAAIRADLDFAIANLPALSASSGFRATKNAALALRARFELRMRNYADALKYAQQVPAATMTTLASTTTPDAIWQLYFSATDTNLYAFYWYLAPGGRNEFDPSPSLIAAHPAGDLRLPINATSIGTTLKYTHTTTRDDYYNMIRYTEVVLTIAESAAQTGDLVTATTQLNIIRKRAGLANTTAITAADLIADILLQRRLELAHEGHYWFDLRRTNTVQSALGSTTTANAYNQTFRNLFPLPLRDVNLSNGVLVQNTGF